MFGEIGRVLLIILSLLTTSGCAAIGALALSAAGSAGGAVGGEAVKKKLFPGEEKLIPPIGCNVSSYHVPPIPNAQEARKLHIRATKTDSVAVIDNENYVPIIIRKERGGKPLWHWKIMNACERMADDIEEGDAYFVTTLGGHPIVENFVPFPQK